MKVLFFWSGLGSIPPIGCSLLRGLLHDNGAETDVFSTDNLLHCPASSRGQLILSTESRDNKLDPILFELGINAAVAELASKISHFNPDVLALSAFSCNYLIAMEIIRRLGQKNFYLLVGGVHATFCPQDVINNPLVDAICVGDGEDMIVKFAQIWKQKTGIIRDFSMVPNLWWKKNGDIEVNSGRSLIDLNDDSTYCQDYSAFSVAKIHFVGKIYRSVYMETSRGCPLNCRFCSNKKQMKIMTGVNNPIPRRTTPAKSVERVKKVIAKTDAQLIRFVDQEFLAAPVSWVEEFSHLYKKEVGLPFFIAASGKTINEDRVRLIADAGCVNINLGVEGGGGEYRAKILNKSISDEDILKVVSTANKYGIRMNMNFMLGLPGQTKKSFNDAENLVRAAKLPVSICYYMPLPGSEFYDNLLKTGKFEGFKTAYDEYRGQGEPIYIPEGLSRECLVAEYRTFELRAVAHPFLKPVINFCRRPGPISDKLLDILAKYYAF